jgi:hypothetical protein
VSFQTFHSHTFPSPLNLTAPLTKGPATSHYHAATIQPFNLISNANMALVSSDLNILSWPWPYRSTQPAGVFPRVSCMPYSSQRQHSTISRTTLILIRMYRDSMLLRRFTTKVPRCKSTRILRCFTASSIVLPRWLEWIHRTFVGQEQQDAGCASLTRTPTVLSSDFYYICLSCSLPPFPISSFTFSLLTPIEPRRRNRTEDYYPSYTFLEAPPLS